MTPKSKCTKITLEYEDRIETLALGANEWEEIIDDLIDRAIGDGIYPFQEFYKKYPKFKIEYKLKLDPTRPDPNQLDILH